MSKQTVKEQVERYCRELRLPTIRECYEDEARKAEQEQADFTEFLLEVLKQESEVRLQKRTERWLSESRLPLHKNLESFDLKRLPKKVMHQVKVLRDGSFLGRKENVLAFGNPGSGKTHLVSAIGQELIHQGFRVYFCECRFLVEMLLREKRELRLEKKLRSLKKYDALILDDIGYVQQDREEMEVLFTLLAQRYERGSVMITSNLPFSKWDSIFKDTMTTAAAIDRVVHHSVILELNIPSYRMEAAQIKIEKERN
ncbi:MAG: IS21-like element helper ATPase IstB [Deltaproteobacteria bacterium]|nr:IS21-like element helper ATPase IstB [Deltaproteobacteria bacterium]MBW2106585.1 IS21-like element helper ATPase IstB [Deltaproteobacteria bacterium]